ncbi:MAG TPA: S9 family peptidase [Candidatus Bathyarchaeia archaeon]|nr:S9 family peptidase [Candidatus Bathyarchaeia archaeon]
MKRSLPADVFAVVALAALCVVAVCSSTGAIDKKPLTPGEIWRLKAVGEPQLSPDGKWIAYTVTTTDLDKNSRNADVWLVSSDGGEPRRLTTSEKRDDTPVWSPDGASLAFISARDGDPQIFILPVGGGEARRVTDFPGGVDNMIWTPNGKGFVFAARTYLDCADLDCIKKKDKEKEESKLGALVHDHLMYRHWNEYEDGKVQHLFYIPVDGGAPRNLTKELKYDALTFFLASAGRDFEISPDGGMLYFSGKQDSNQAVSYNEDVWCVPLAGGAVKRVTTNLASDTHPRVSPDGKYLAYRATRRPGYESDREELMVMALPNGAPRSITADFDREVGDFFWAADGKLLYFEAEDRGDVNLFVVPAAGGAVRPVISAEAAGHGYHVDVAAGPKDEFFVYRHRPMAHTYEIFRCDRSGKNVKQITFANKDAYDTYFVPQAAEEYWWKGPDGADVEGWLIKPANFDPSKKYPMMVRVHGGPQQMWVNGFRTEFALFPGAGYAVFFCNPRGSFGYGQKFCDGIRGDWGGTVVEDLKAGVRTVLAKNPWIDAARVGAWGDSYGGFFCNWLQGHNDDHMFAALVSHAGDAEEWSSYGSTEELWFPEWDLTGTPWDKPDVYDRLSPIRYAKHFGTPHLFTHGDLDYRVPITGGETMFTALQRLGIPSKMIRFTDEGHWIQKPQNAKFWYQSVLDWFDRWLKTGK